MGGAHGQFAALVCVAHVDGIVGAVVGRPRISAVMWVLVAFSMLGWSRTARGGVGKPQLNCRGRMTPARWRRLVLSGRLESAVVCSSLTVRKVGGPF